MLQIKTLFDIGPRSFSYHGFALCQGHRSQVHNGQVQAYFFFDHLARLAPHHFKVRAQGLMPAHDLLETLVNSFYIEAALYLPCSSYVVGSRSRFKTVNEPKPLLRTGERKWLLPVDGQQWGWLYFTCFIPRLLDSARHLAHGWRFK